MKNKDIVLKAVAYLHGLDSSTEITTCRVLDEAFGFREDKNGKYRIGESVLSFVDLLDLDLEIRKAAKKSGLLLDDSKYAGMDVGLPFHIPYIVKKKNN